MVRILLRGLLLLAPLRHASTAFLLAGRTATSYLHHFGHFGCWPKSKITVDTRPSTSPLYTRKLIASSAGGKRNIVSYEETDDGDNPNMENRDDLEDEEECDIEAPEGYCSKYDDLGFPAFEKEEPFDVADGSSDRAEASVASDPTRRSETELQWSCIRLQALADSCLGDLKTSSDVEISIKETKERMNQHRRADLYAREWEALEHRPRDNDSGYSFNAMQFNTLAEGLSSASSAASPFGKSTSAKGRKKDKGYGGFTDVPEPDVVLDFSLRRWRLLEVIIGNSYRESTDSDISSTDGGMKCNFDLVAMEEVDRFNGFFKPALEKFGYAGLFQPKPRAPGIDLGYYSDGCALFWKEETFDLISQRGQGYAVGTQVYLIANLRHRPSGRPIVVAVTHLKAQESETNEKIRTMQATELVRLVADAASVAAASSRGNVSPEDIPILIMGDFNAEPVGEGKTCVRTVTGRTDWPRFKSAYDIDPPRSSFFTTWKTRGAKTVRRIIDYMFYNSSPGSTGGMQLTHILGLPKEEEMESHHLPGFRYPSDHLAIGARFKLDP